MRKILHLYADIGIEDEVLHTFGSVTRVGIDPEPNPYSTAVQSDASRPPLSGGFDLAVANPPCQRFSRSTHGTGDPEDHPDLIAEARGVCEDLADHWIIENVPQAPLKDSVELTGYHFGKPVKYPRAFESNFHIPAPNGKTNMSPDIGPLESQGKTGKAWVGTTDSWRLSKGYSHDWPGRDLKRHAVPRAYLEYLLYYWLSAIEEDRRGSSRENNHSGYQSTIATGGDDK